MRFPKSQNPAILSSIFLDFSKKTWYFRFPSFGLQIPEFSNFFQAVATLVHLRYNHDLCSQMVIPHNFNLLTLLQKF